MARIEWSCDLELGIPELDLQHRTLVDLANRFYEAIASGRGAGETGRAIAQLLDYAEIHFRDEERYFAQFNSPNLERHSQGHADFLSSVQEFGSRLGSSGPVLANELMLFLSSWVARHIGREDRELARMAQRARTQAQRCSD